MSLTMGTETVVEVWLATMVAVPLEAVKSSGSAESPSPAAAAQPTLTGPGLVSLTLMVKTMLPADSFASVPAMDTMRVLSSSVMVTVCCVPMFMLLCEAVITTVSASSSSRSSTAVTVAVTEVAPAVSVSDSALML